MKRAAAISIAALLSVGGATTALVSIAGADANDPSVTTTTEAPATAVTDFSSTLAGHGEQQSDGHRSDGPPPVEDRGVSADHRNDNHDRHGPDVTNPPTTTPPTTATPPITSAPAQLGSSNRQGSESQSGRNSRSGSPD